MSEHKLNIVIFLDMLEEVSKQIYHKQFDQLRLMENITAQLVTSNKVPQTWSIEAVKRWSVINRKQSDLVQGTRHLHNNIMKKKSR